MPHPPPPHLLRSAAACFGLTCLAPAPCRWRSQPLPPEHVAYNDGKGCGAFFALDVPARTVRDSVLVGVGVGAGGFCGCVCACLRVYVRVCVCVSYSLGFFSDSQPRLGAP